MQQQKEKRREEGPKEHLLNEPGKWINGEPRFGRMLLIHLREKRMHQNSVDIVSIFKRKINVTINFAPRRTTRLIYFAKR